MNGTRFLSPQVWATGVTFSTGSEAASYVGDINGDGLADFVSKDGNRRGKFYLSTGVTFIDSGMTSNQATGALDVTGDGLLNLVEGDDYYHFPGPRPNVLTDVVTPSGLRMSVSYMPSGDIDGNNRPIAPSELVSSVVLDDGVNPPAETTYHYHAGFYDRDERQFAGYREVTVTRPCVAGEVVRPQVKTTYSTARGAVGRAEMVERIVDGVVVSRKRTQFAVRDDVLPYRAVAVAEWQEEEPEDLSGGAVRVVQKVYDHFGNLSVEIDHGDLAVSGDELSRHRFFRFYTAGFIYNKPAYDTLYGGAAVTPTASAVGSCYELSPNWTTRPLSSCPDAVRAANVYMLGQPLQDAAGQPLPLQQKTLLSYDHNTFWLIPPSRGLVTKTERYLASENRYVTEQYTYDSFGNLTAKIDPLNRLSFTQYDSQHHLYPVKQRNPLFFANADRRQEVTMSYHPVCGTPLMVTDLNGQTTSYQYDALCRETRVDKPGGDYQTTAYVNFGTPTLQHVEQKTPTPDSLSELWTRTYFVGSGKPYKVTQSAEQVTTTYLQDQFAQPTLMQQLAAQADRINTKIQTLKTHVLAYTGFSTNAATNTNIQAQLIRFLTEIEDVVQYGALYTQDLSDQIDALPQAGGHDLAFHLDDLERKLDQVILDITTNSPSFTAVRNPLRNERNFWVLVTPVTATPTALQAMATQAQSNAAKAQALIGHVQAYTGFHTNAATNANQQRVIVSYLTTVLKAMGHATHYPLDAYLQIQTHAQGGGNDLAWHLGDLEQSLDQMTLDITTTSPSFAAIRNPSRAAKNFWDDVQFATTTPAILAADKALAGVIVTKIRNAIADTQIYTGFGTTTAQTRNRRNVLNGYFNRLLNHLIFVEANTYEATWQIQSLPQAGGQPIGTHLASLNQTLDDFAQHLITYPGWVTVRTPILNADDFWRHIYMGTPTIRQAPRSTLTPTPPVPLLPPLPVTITASTIDVLVDHNARGLVARKSLPHYTGAQVEYTSYTYDGRNRVLTQTLPDGNVIAHAYGLQDALAGDDPRTFTKTTTTDELGRIRVEQKDVFDRLVREDRYLNGLPVSTIHTYDPLGQLIGLEDDAGNTWAYRFDSLGRRIVTDDPDLGVWSYTYDDAGQLTSQTDHLGQRRELTYDALGRVLTATDRAGTSAPEITTNAYDEDRPGFFNMGQLTTATNANLTIAANFDLAGNGVETIYTLGSGFSGTPLGAQLAGNSYTVTTGFGLGGAVLWRSYPDGDSIGSVTNPWSYDGAGKLVAIPGAIQTLQYTADGNTDFVTYPNGIATDFTYDQKRGWLSSIATGQAGQAPVYQYDYTRDGETG